MASIPYLLMQEFHAEAQRALEAEDYDTKQAFDTAEGMVNNFLHGNTPARCLALTRAVLLSYITEEKYHSSDAEKKAYTTGIVLIDLFIEEYSLEVVTL